MWKWDPVGLYGPARSGIPVFGSMLPSDRLKLGNTDMRQIAPLRNRAEIRVGNGVHV